jgi:hypothetical protein
MPPPSPTRVQIMMEKSTRPKGVFSLNHCSLLLAVLRHILIRFDNKISPNAVDDLTLSQPRRVDRCSVYPHRGEWIVARHVASCINPGPHRDCRGLTSNCQLPTDSSQPGSDPSIISDVALWRSLRDESASHSGAGEMTFHESSGPACAALGLRWSVHCSESKASRSGPWAPQIAKLALLPSGLCLAACHARPVRDPICFFNSEPLPPQPGSAYRGPLFAESGSSMVSATNCSSCTSATQGVAPECINTILTQQAVTSTGSVT